MIKPYDYLTWGLEIFPVAIALPVLFVTARRYPLTPLLYWLIGLHCLVLILGAHYTYARVPLGFWVQDALELARNHYDRLGHFMQGFVPAIAAREIFKRFVAAEGRRLAQLPDHHDLPRDQRDVRVPGMVGRDRRRRRRRRFPVHAGRRLGHAVGHVPRRLRRGLAILTLSRVHDRAIARLGAP